MRPIWLALALLMSTGVATARADERTYPATTEILVDPMASPYRVHVARMGEVRLVPGGPANTRGGHTLERMLEVAVVEERAGLVRVVYDHDDARVMLWVKAADLTWSIARPVRLAGRGDDGVWLGTGAPVTVTGAGRKRTVTYTDGDITVRGVVAADAVTRVFPVSVRGDRTFGATAREIRIAPGGAVLRSRPIGVDVVQVRGAWTEVEHRSRYLRIRGWVANARLSDDLFNLSGTGAGSAIGMSDTPLVDIPAGACLYDGRGGAPVGVQLVAARRYVAGHDGDWWQVYLATPWGTVQPWAHALGDDGAGDPRWERCTPTTPAPTVFIGDD
jgi:hypothetical protein